MEKQNKVNVSEGNKKFSGVLKSAAARIVLTVIAVLVIIFTAVLIVFDYANNSERNQAEDIPNISLSGVYLGGTPDIKSSYGEYDYYLNLDGMNEDPVSSLNELSEYKRSLRIIHSYGGISDAESVVLTKSGDCIKAESDSREIIKNEKRISADYGSQRIVGNTEGNEFFQEVGITSLSILKEMCRDEENYEKTLSITDDKRFVNVELYDRKTGISMNFEIDVETGIIITERFYSDGLLYRFVFTENITRNINIEEGFFDINE